MITLVLSQGHPQLSAVLFKRKAGAACSMYKYEYRVQVASNINREREFLEPDILVFRCCIFIIVTSKERTFTFSISNTVLFQKQEEEHT